MGHSDQGRGIAKATVRGLLLALLPLWQDAGTFISPLTI